MSAVTVDRELLQILLDMCVNSMDFGSGFLENDDAEALRTTAVVLGVDPNKVTPWEFLRNYPHPFDEYPWRRCRCGLYGDDPIRHGA